MKKYFLIASAAVMLMACGAKQNQTVSYDLAFYGLKGDVKKMDKIEFDQSGKITLIDGKNLFELETPQRSYNEETGEFTDIEKWTRDDKGRIISQRAIEYEQIYVWEGSQIVRDTVYCEGQIYLTKYEYDKDFNRVKCTTEMCEDNGEFKFEPCGFLEFTYKDFDSHSNWTKCITKRTDQVTKEVSEDEQTRKIEYWK